MFKNRLNPSDERVAWIGGYLLLMLLSAMIFVVPVFPRTWHGLLFSVLYMSIFIAAALVMERHRRLFLGVAITLSVIEALSNLLGLSSLAEASQVLSISFFGIVVFRLISRIARTRNVTHPVIVAALNGYLLLGTMGSIVVAMIKRFDPMAYTGFAASPDPTLNWFSEVLYYGFVTFTTVGYGDVTPTAQYTKSLAILMGVTGQMYVAIIIAMLVGKYAGSALRD